MTARYPTYRSGCDLETMSFPTDIIPGVNSMVARVSGINGLATGTGTLFTPDLAFWPTGLIVEATLATGVTVPPVLGVGVAAGEDDIIFPQLLTGLLTTAKIHRIPLIGIAVKVTAGQTIKYGIDTGGTGTTLTMKMILEGILEPA